MVRFKSLINASQLNKLIPELDPRFYHYHSEQLPSAVARYINETRRVLSILDTRLSRPGGNGWLVLGRITVADISFYHWYLHAKRLKIDIKKDFPAVGEWMGRMKERDGIRRGSKGVRFPEEGAAVKH